VNWPELKAALPDAEGYIVRKWVDRERIVFGPPLWRVSAGGRCVEMEARPGVLADIYAALTDNMGAAM